MGAEQRANGAAQRQKTLLDHGIEQLLAGVEIVVQHRRRHARLFGNGVEGGAGNPLTRKEIQRDIQQLFPAGGGGFASARTPRAAGLWPGFRIIFMC